MQKIIQVVKKTFSGKDMEIKRIWYENKELYIHINSRCAIFNLPLQDKNAIFVVDIFKSHKLKKSETILTLSELV